MKEQTRLIIWVSVCLVLISLLIMAGYVCYVGADAEYTNDDDNIQRESALIVSDNTFGFGNLYAVDADGRTTSVFASVGSPHVSGWELGAICEPDRAEDSTTTDFYGVFSTIDKGYHHVLMRVAKFSDKLNVTELTREYRLHLDGRISGLSMKGTTLYVTELHGGGQNASVFEIDTSELKALSSRADELDAEAVELDESHSIRSGSGDVFAQAEFESGVLHTRLSRETDEYFAEDEFIKSRFDARKMGFGDKWAARSLPRLLIAGVPIILVLLTIVFVNVLYGRRRAVYRIAVFEIILFLLMVGSLCSLTVLETNLEREQFLKYEAYALRNLGLYDIPDVTDSEFYASNDYWMLVDDIRALMDDNGDAEHKVSDVCICDALTGEIIVDGMHKERQGLGFVYGNRAMSALSGNTRVALKIRPDGLPATAISQPIVGSGDYRIVGIFSHADFVTVLTQTGQARVWTMLLLFVVLSLAGCIFLLIESHDLELLRRTLDRLAGGELEFEKPQKIYGWDINRMWNSIHEIEKNIREVNRMQFMTYRAYYRFAPKGIERILQKDSIIEVKDGDMIRSSGTMAYLSGQRQYASGEDGEMQMRSRQLRILEKYCAQEDGLFISGDAYLAFMRILFLENTRHSVRFAVELLQEVMSTADLERMDHTPAILLHYTQFEYGVAGSDQQANAFLLTRDGHEISGYLDFFRSLGLRVVLTETVKEREAVTDVRYIGFVRTGSEDGGTEKWDIYEALDAEDFAVRQGKRRTRKAFADALALFYRKDFYFARNAFAALIQEVPQDLVAKWYLFECERLLNETADASFEGEMHR